MTYERVTLFGLPFVPRRRVALAPIDPPAARELLIREGLVEEKLHILPEFLKQKRRLIAELECTQEKLRRHNLLLGPWAQIEFYERRIPEHVCDFARLEAWRKEAERREPRLLLMSREELLTDPAASADPDAFPDQLTSGGIDLPLRYRFEPGSDDDGVCVTTPLEGIDRLEAGRLEWLVPGLLESKLAALIKSLPKLLRKRLVPAPDTARQVAGQLRFGEGNLLTILAQQLSRIAGERITAADFQLEQVPRELRMAVRVIDEGGETVASGRDLSAVRRELGHLVSENIAGVEYPAFQRDGLTVWDFDELPRAVEVPCGAMSVRCFPMLVDLGTTAALRLAETPEEAERESRRGAVRLFALAARRDIRAQIAWFPDLQAMTLHAATLPDFELKRELGDLLACRAFPAETAARTQTDFEQRVAQGRERLGLAAQEVAALLPALLAAYHDARLAGDQIVPASPAWQEIRTDVDRQLERLTVPGFLTRTPWQWLGHYRRYFRAIRVRVERLRTGGSLEQGLTACRELHEQWEAYESRAKEQAQLRVDDPELLHLRWMLEEYRVSLFAQTLGTSFRVSPQRIARQWEKVRT